MRTLSKFLILFTFWLCLSGKFHWQDSDERFLMFTGFLVCLFVTWIALRKQILDEEGHPVHLLIKIGSFLPYLFLEIIKANIEVAYCVWHPKPNIHSSFIRIPYAMETSMMTVLYANSITLTPGTVTVSVDEDKKEMLIHVLTKKARADLQSGAMHDRILKLEKRSN